LSIHCLHIVTNIATIKIPTDLPAFKELSKEGVMVVSEEEATRQDIRPLQIGLLNLMPTKIQTETQFARLIGATPLQIELTLIRMSEHHSKNTSPVHMETFYQPVSEILSKITALLNNPFVPCNGFLLPPQMILIRNLLARFFVFFGTCFCSIIFSLEI